MMKNYDAVIIGAGPAGLTAAMYLARANKKTAIFEKLTAGGKLAVTPVIENYPGAESEDGFTIAETMRSQAEKCGAEFVYAEISAVDFRELTVTAGGETYAASAIVIATGAKSGKLGLSGEKELSGNGVSYCAVCDGALFRGKDVVLAGAGDRALKDLNYLAGICRKVYFVTPNAFGDNKWDNVEILEKSEVTRLVGKPLEKIVVSGLGTEREIETPALFVDVGIKPDGRIFAGELETDTNGFILTDENMRTSVKGVFAAGDVRSKTLRQVVTAAGDGAIASMSAIKEMSQNRKAAKKN